MKALELTADLTENASKQSRMTMAVPRTNQDWDGTLTLKDYSGIEYIGATARFKTVEQMRLMPGLREDVCYSLDQGTKAGMFKIDTADTSSEDDGVMCLVTAGGKRLKRVIDNFINLTWFGAVGNDSTDNTGAFSSALSYLDKRGGGVLFIPRGIFRTNALVPPKRVKFLGEGMQVTVLKLNPGSTADNMFDLKVAYEGSINELTLDGNRANQTKPINAISFNNVTNNANSNYRYEVRRAYIIDHSGSGVVAQEKAWVFRVRDCSIRRNAKYGIENYSSDNSFDDNEIALNEMGGIYNAGNNTRYSGGKILFNGKGLAGSAGIMERSARSTFSHIECQENYYHGVAIVTGSYSSFTGVLSDMNNVIARTEALGSSTGHIPGNIAYGWYFDSAKNIALSDCLCTSAKPVGDPGRTQHPVWVTATCEDIPMEGLMIEPNQAGPVRDDTNGNRGIIWPQKRKGTTVADNHQIQNFDLITLGTIAEDKVLTLPSDPTIIDFIVFNYNSGAGVWTTSANYRDRDGSNKNTLANGATYVFKKISNAWRVTAGPGGSSTGGVTLDTAQSITGSKTFTATLNVTATSNLAAVNAGRIVAQAAGSYSIIAGANSGASTITANTNKEFRLGMPSYASGSATSNLILPFYGVSNATSNVLNIGGGSSAGSALTQINFYTDPSNASTNATRRMYLSPAGNLVLDGSVSDNQVDRLQVPGSGSFTGTVTAAAPTADTHLATQGYVKGSRTTAAYNAGAIATGTQVSQNLSLSAAMGQFAQAAFTANLQGVRMWAEVTSLNTVTVYFRNDTGASVTPSGTINVRVNP